MSTTIATIRTRLATQLAAITAGGNFTHTIGSGRVWNPDRDPSTVTDAERPSIGIGGSMDLQLTDGANGCNVQKAQIPIIGYAPRTGSSEAARQAAMIDMAQDIKAAIATDHTIATPGCWARLVNALIDVGTEGQKSAIVVYVLEVEYTTAEGLL
jgi:hypothetical protein